MEWNYGTRFSMSSKSSFVRTKTYYELTVSNGKFVFCFQMEHVNEKTECVLNELNSKICLNLGYTTAKIHIISSQKSTTDQSQSGQ